MDLPITINVPDEGARRSVPAILAVNRRHPALQRAQSIPLESSEIATSALSTIRSGTLFDLAWDNHVEAPGSDQIA